MPHKICFVCPGGYPVLACDDSRRAVGGSEVQQTILARELARRGHHISMITRYDGRDGQVVDGVSVYGAFKRNAGIPKMQSLYRYLTLCSAMNRAGATIYYTQNCSSYVGVMAAFAKLRSQKTIYCGASDFDFEANIPYLNRSIEKKLYRYGIRNVTRVIAQSPRQQRACRDSFGVDSEVIRSAYGHKGENGKREGLIIWSANIKPIKQPELFVELARACPEFRFRMIGGGNESHLRTVMETAAGINNIEFTGFVPYDKVERHFDGASLIINTSITEGFPNTFLQGWSRGVPSVSFFDPDAYIDGKSVGVVVKSMEEMISRVKNLKSDDALWKVYSEDCRRYFWQNFSLDKICDEYEVLFDRLNAVCGSLDS